MNLSTNLFNQRVVSTILYQMLFVSFSYSGVCYLPSKAFSFLPHSCSEKFYWRSKVSIILERENIYCLIFFFCNAKTQRGLFHRFLKQVVNLSYFVSNTQPHPYNVNIPSPEELFLKSYYISKRKLSWQEHGITDSRI